MAPTRQRRYVDHNVQGALLARAALYGSCTAVYFTTVLICGDALAHPLDSWPDSLRRCLDEIIFWLPGVAILTPIIAYDILQLSSRFAGPLFRLRRQMRALAQGEPTEPLNFREDDYWAEMAEIFNTLRDELTEWRSGAKPSEASSLQHRTSASRLSQAPPSTNPPSTNPPLAATPWDVPPGQTRPWDAPASG